MKLLCLVAVTTFAAQLVVAMYRSQSPKSRGGSLAAIASDFVKVLSEKMKVEHEHGVRSYRVERAARSFGPGQIIISKNDNYLPYVWGNRLPFDCIYTDDSEVVQECEIVFNPDCSYHGYFLQGDKLRPLRHSLTFSNMITYSLSQLPENELKLALERVNSHPHGPKATVCIGNK